MVDPNQQYNSYLNVNIFNTIRHKFSPYDKNNAELHAIYK